MMDWKYEFLKLHYEPEHEKGIVCWCQPRSLMKDGVNYIEHNEQRVLLIDFVEKLVEKTQLDMITKMSEIARMDPKKCPRCKMDLVKDESQSGPTWATYWCPCSPDVRLSVG